jgi:hypothetical protein
MPVQWMQESCDLYDDPESGARIVQLTSSSMTSNNIYGEQPYTSPDGKRVIIARCHDFCFDDRGSLLVHELDTLKITMIERDAVGARGVFNNAWSGLCYYWNANRELVQLSLLTLEKKVVYKEEDPKAPLIGGSVSPDQRYVLGMTTRLIGPGSPVYQIVRLDLQKKIVETIYEDREISNPHLQFNPIHGREILVQNNRGSRLMPDGSVEHYDRGKGGTLFVINADGTNKRYLPVGPPITAGITGHECFVGDTGKALYSVTWDSPDVRTMRHDKRHPRGNIFTARPGDEKGTLFEAPEHFFNHVCVSRDGKYFVADSYEGGGVFDKNNRIRPVSLVVGNLDTGKYRTLVRDSMSSGGGNQCRHTHPYLTADNRHVIYNADPYFSNPQVFAARIPPEFLKSLD